MTEDTLLKAVQAHFSDFSTEMGNRIKGTLPLALELFCNEHQWQFLKRQVDSLSTTTSNTSTGDAPGKYIVDTSGVTGFSRPIHMWTDSGPIRSVDDEGWANTQRTGASSLTPPRFMIIGDEIVLTANTSDSISMIYTRNHDNVQLKDVPTRLHVAIEALVELKLTPAHVNVNGQPIPNPEHQVAVAWYDRQLALAKQNEISAAEDLNLYPAEVVQRVTAYD